MSLPDAVSQRVTSLLRAYAGTHVHIAHSEPVTEGWSAQFGPNPWPWVTRCAIVGATGAAPGSVIVKARRPAGHRRGEPERFHHERAALGRMHAATAGHAMEYYKEYYKLRSRRGPVDPAVDQISILGIDIERAWGQLREIAADRPYLPPPPASVRISLSYCASWLSLAHISPSPMGTPAPLTPDIKRLREVHRL